MFVEANSSCSRRKTRIAQIKLMYVCVYTENLKIPLLTQKLGNCALADAGRAYQR
jgi:hypothetical protein